MLSLARLSSVRRRLVGNPSRFSFADLPGCLFSSSSDFKSNETTAVLQELQKYLNLITGKRVLTVGDGDFSFSKALVKWNICKAVHATTLETRENLVRYYPIASDMMMSIEQSSQSDSETSKNKTFFQVDGTKLEKTLPANDRCDKYDVVIWNFPHIAGKQNIRYNRQLLASFFKSASQVLDKDACILISLVERQSGFSLGPIDDDRAFRWTSSWQLIDQVADSGLLITDHGKFEWSSIPGYNPTGWRGCRGTFATGNAEFFCLQPARENRTALQAPLYVAELHLWWNPEHKDLAKLEKDSLIHIKDILNDFTAIDKNTSALEKRGNEKTSVNKMADVDCLVSIVDMYHNNSETPEAKAGHGVVIVLQIGFLSLSKACNRALAEECRSIVEQQLPRKLNMPPRVEKLGNRVSKPYPWFVTEALAKGADRSEQFQSANALLEKVYNHKEPNSDTFSPAQHLIQHKLWRRRVGIVFRGPFSD